MYKAIKEVKKRFPDGPPLLNPVKDMKIQEPDFLEIVRKIELLEKKYVEFSYLRFCFMTFCFVFRLYEHPLHNTPELDSEYPKYETKVKAEEELNVAKQKLMEAKSILQLDELKCRKRVLRRLGYCTNADVIELKGRVACELSRSGKICAYV